MAVGMTLENAHHNGKNGQPWNCGRRRARVYVCVCGGGGGGGGYCSLYVSSEHHVGCILITYVPKA